MPSRDDLPVQELTPWLGYLALFDALSDGGFRFRVCGTALIGRFGREATGQLVSDLAKGIREPLSAALRQARAAYAPVTAVHRLQFGRIYRIYSELFLPLTNDSGQVTMLLMGSYQVGAVPPV